MNASDHEGVIKAVEKMDTSRCLVNATSFTTAVFPTRILVSYALLVPLKYLPAAGSEIGDSTKHLLSVVYKRGIILHLGF